MLNQAQIIGRVGKDPEVRYLSSGEAVANFSLATTEKWKDKASGEARESTEWHRISAFGRTAEIVGEYVKKGALIYISGKIKTRSYDHHGETRYVTEIHASDMKMLSSRNEGDAPRPQQSQQTARQSQQRQAPRNSVADLDDDIPF